MTKVATKTKRTWQERVIDFIEGGDVGRLSKLKKENLRELNEQIRLRQVELDKISTKKDEKLDELEEKSLNVEPEGIKTAEDRESFIPRFNSSLFGILAKYDDLEEREAAIRAEIDKYSQLIELFESK